MVIILIPSVEQYCTKLKLASTSTAELDFRRAVEEEYCTAFGKNDKCTVPFFQCTYTSNVLHQRTLWGALLPFCVRFWGDTSICCRGQNTLLENLAAFSITYIQPSQQEWEHSWLALLVPQIISRDSFLFHTFNFMASSLRKDLNEVVLCSILVMFHPLWSEQMCSFEGPI